MVTTRLWVVWSSKQKSSWTGKTNTGTLPSRIDGDVNPETELISVLYSPSISPSLGRDLDLNTQLICPYISLSWAQCQVQFRCPPSPPYLPAHTCHSFPSLCSRRLLLLPQLVLMLHQEGNICWFRITSLSSFKILPPIMLSCLASLDSSLPEKQHCF